jgi:hypothetical protein
METGYYQRPKIKATVLRGFDPQNPTRLTQGHRVKAGVTILSGMIISLATGADGVLEWEKGWASGRVPYLAVQDSVDFDVRAASSLVGFSCLGNFEFQTGYFKSGETYTVDTPLTAGTGGDLGYVKPTTLESGDPILGYVTRANAPVDLAAGGAKGYPADSSAVDSEVIRFQSTYLPNTADAIA